ncbi:hypothetical protein ACHAPJ_006695 [Fusarium lateritium]
MGRPTVVVSFFGDQLFWGQMVSNAGAGPQPIPYSSLTSTNLTAAIDFALEPQVMAAAQEMSSKMSQESGVRSAVEHFHSNLPARLLRCDLFPELAASWSYKGRIRVLLSKRAERVLTQAGKLDQKKLKIHKSKPIFIESRRSDPITAAGSASIEAAATIAEATVGIFSKPYETIKQSHTQPKTSSDGESSQEGSSSNMRQAKTPNVATDAIRGSTKGLGILALTSAKGILVDIPVAVTDGLRAVPHLYGEDVRRRGNISGFRAGAVVAGKSFYHGMFEAITDIAVYTYHGKREENAIGAAKGLGKGLLSLVTKSTAATIGLVAYPAQGLGRTIHDSLVTSVPRAIQSAIKAEGDWILERNPASDEEVRCAVADFATLCGTNV